MASERPLVHPDHYGPYSKENSRQMNCSSTFKRKSKSSLRKNLFPGKYPMLFYQTKKVFSEGVAKINKVYSDLKWSLRSTTQSLSFNSYKQYEFEDCGKNSNCPTPNRRIRSVLGRTPTKLYSPFGIETPANLKY